MMHDTYLTVRMKFSSFQYQLYITISLNITCAQDLLLLNANNLNKLLMARGTSPRAIRYSRDLEAVGLAQFSNFGLQLLFFAISLFARRQDYS